MADLPNDGDLNWGAPLRAYMEETRGIAGEASGVATTATATAEEALALAEASIAPTDGAVATLLGTPSSSTATTLAASYRAGRAVPFNTLDFGTVGNGVADDTAALNAAFTAASAVPDARVYIPPGTYRTTGTVNMTCAVDGSLATIRYAGTGTAVIAGTPVVGGAVSRVKMDLPRVILTTRPSASTWDGTSVGVKVNNANGCTVYIPFVQDFEYGVLMYGADSACAYNTIHLGALWNNHCNMWLDSTDVGYTNQNLFIGGRFQQTLTSGAADEDVNAYQLRLGRPGSVKVVNDNTWIGTSFEGDNPAYYRLWCDGRYNNFYNCRWECYNDAQSRVYWGPRSYGNIIHGGYEAFKMTQVNASGAWSNTIVDDRGYYIRATNSTTQSIASGTSWVDVLWQTATSRRAVKNVAETAWTPEAGTWQINVAIGFTGNATGYRGVRILRGGADTIGLAQSAPAGTDSVILNVSCTATFNGSQAFVVQARQTSGASLTIPTTPGYAVIQAQRIGVEGPP